VTSPPCPIALYIDVEQAPAPSNDAWAVTATAWNDVPASPAINRPPACPCEHLEISRRQMVDTIRYDTEIKVRYKVGRSQLNYHTEPKQKLLRKKKKLETKIGLYSEETIIESLLLLLYTFS